jgi:hypothetical protein
MSADSDQYFEFSRLNSGMLSYSMGEDWKTSYYSMYGSNSVIYDKIGAGVDADRHLQNLGYHPTFIPNDLLYSMLVNSGIKSYSDSLNEEVKYEIDFDHDKYHKLGVAIEIASQFEPGIAGIVDMIGVWQSDDITVYGKTINMNKPIEDRIILINKDHVEGSNMADLVATIIHEYDHLSTGLRDGNQEGRMFRDLADKRIGRMMLKMFKQNAYNIVGDVLEFPLSKVHLLRGDISWEMSRIDFCNKIILRVGGCSFMINGDATYNGSILDRYENGNLLPNSSASALTVTSLANVKDVIALG